MNKIYHCGEDDMGTCVVVTRLAFISPPRDYKSVVSHIFC